MVLAMTIAVLAVSSQAMTACQQAEDTATQHATTTQERTTIQGATTAASTHSPGVVTTLRAWGNNYLGQLGDGTYDNNRTRPVKVGGLRGAKVEALAGGQGHTLALKGDRTVLAWGYNRDGELGNGAPPTLRKPSARTWRSQVTPRCAPAAPTAPPRCR